MFTPSWPQSGKMAQGTPEEEETTEDQQCNSDNDDKLSILEKSKLDSYLSAFIEARTELSRRILTISSAALGLLLTLAASLKSPPQELEILIGASVVSFAGAIFSTMRSIWLDSQYLTEAADDLFQSGRSDATASLSRKTECWGSLGRWLFGFGVLILIVLILSILQTNG